MDFVSILQDYGFPMVAAVAMAYFIYFIYTFITTEIKVKLGEANTVLIALIDRIRMLDNDIINPSFRFYFSYPKIQFASNPSHNYMLKKRLKRGVGFVSEKD